MNETVPLKIPPGVFRPGTLYDARGRWWSSNLVRWSDNALGPVGGWTDFNALTVDGPVRGMHPWRALGGTPHLGLGTPTSLYVIARDALTEISPADLVSGFASSSTIAGAYGAGYYGEGPYGGVSYTVPYEAEATSWSLDNFGEDLVAVSGIDGRLLRWSPGDTVAAPVPGAPSANRGVVVTPERFVVLLGANGDGRQIQWCDQENIEEWNPVNTTAGDLTLTDSGEIMCGLRGRSETLIWTDAALYSLRYIGPPFIYGIQRVASGCGIISRLAAGEMAGAAYWMGRKGFFMYAQGGGVQPIPCEIAEYIFQDINLDQSSKICCRVLSDVGEVTWHYPSALSSENDRYATFNAREGVWFIGELERTSGVDRIGFDTPIAADATGNLYLHETGTSYLDTDGVTPITPYIESGPIEIGEKVMNVLRVVPDEGTLGDVQLTMYTYARPGEAETTQGPFAISQPTLTRFSGRLVRLRVEFQTGTGRFGTPKIDIRPGGMR